jgi:hypothetical protein
MARYAGKQGLVYVSTSLSGAAASVGQMTQWSLDTSTEKLDVTCFGDTNKVWVQSWGNYQGSFRGFWDDAGDTLFDAQASDDGCNIYLYPSSAAISKYWYGPAFVDLSMETDVNGTVNVSGSFSAAGSWGNTF